ncbi:MAG: DUF3786 domain-containing protein [Desulfobulbaceae bacterium]|nr:DUF3786 domain-containing protein [Desulfobulbaceae bacterium]
MLKLSPLAIVKRTPLNNCGQCGYPTCLAFGAAVVKTGISLSLCPFIDLTGLDQGQMQQEQPKDQKAADLAFIASLKEKIRPFILSDLAPQLGASFNKELPDTLFFRYLGQEVSLSKSSLLIDGHEPEDPRDQILLYNYVFGQGNQPPSNNWVGMESLPNSISKIKTLATYCENRLATLFTNHAKDEIWSAIKAVDGTPSAEQSANISAIIPVLPMIPQSILFWEAAPEDNFTAQVKVLFDRHVLSYLDLESLVFSAERLADRLDLLLLKQPKP